MTRRIAAKAALIAILLQWPGLAAAAPAPSTQATAAADGTWHTLTTPRYTIYSQLAESRTRQWAREFDLFIAAATQLVRSDVRRLPPTTVVLFSRGKAFTPYKPMRPDGKRADYVAGLFSRRPSWGVIGVAGDARSEDSRRTIYHEATHWIMSTDPNARPKWFEEGLAEALSSFEHKSGKVRWGTAIQAHVDNTALVARMPTRPLFNLGDDDPLFNSDDRTGTFYSTSWALVHYLFFSANTAARPKVSGFLKLYQTLSPDEAFDKAFGISYAQLDTDLRAYLHGGRYGINVVPEPAVPDDGVMGTPTSAQVHAALGRLAIATGNDDLARQHADEALSQDPSLVGTRELRAMLAAEADNTQAAEHEARMAVRLGSRDADMFLMLAMSAADAREKADHFERAIMLAPRLRRAYFGLLQALSEVDKPTAIDASYLELGRKAYPHLGSIVFGLADFADRTGDHAKAVKLMNEVTGEGMEAPPPLVEAVHSRLARWAFEETMPLVENELRNARFGEARKLVDQLASRSDDAQFQANIVRLRESVASVERLQQKAQGTPMRKQE